jgi:hypothetical protein
MENEKHVVEKDGDLDVNKVGDAIDRIDDSRKQRILEDFNGFKSYLSKRIQMAQSIGLSEEQLAMAAEKVADYLAEHEEPRNSEENLLQQLWKVGDKDQRHKLAHMLVRLAQSEQ